MFGWNDEMGERREENCEISAERTITIETLHTHTHTASSTHSNYIYNL